MILDERNEFADAASIAAAAGTTLIGDVIDLGANHRSIGNGQPIWLVITVDTGFVAAGAGTIEFRLASDSTADLATSPTVHFSTGALATAASTPATQKAAQVICAVALPIEGVLYERYLGILCVIATQTVSAGKINAFLTLDVTKWSSYAEGAN